MKKLILSIIAVLFALTATAQTEGLYNSAREKASEIIKPDEKSVSESTYPKWVIGFRLGLFDKPDSGGYAFTLENYDAYLQHNLSETLFAYTWVGFRKTKKDEMEGSAYKPNWESKMIFAGFGVYLSEEISVYAAGGKIIAKNENGEEPGLDTGIEYGISYDYKLGKQKANKLVFSFRAIEAKLANQQDRNIAEIQGNGSFSVASIMFAVPLGN